jgi:tetratricopeptide (TPR) repeat protein
MLLEFAPGGRESFGPWSEARYSYTTLWISLTHAAQYLWITTYFAARTTPAEGAARFLGKAWFAGSALYGLPLVLLSPAGLGRVPYDAGLLAMLAGALNLHHVLIDGAIWKLRSGPIARILIRGDAEAGGEPRRHRRWIPALVYASGALGALLTGLGSLEHELGFRRASERGDLPRLELAARRLPWLAREDPALWARIGTLRAERGDLDGALEALSRSLALHPTPGAWIDTGVVRERAGDPAAALRAFEEAVALAPELPLALRRAGQAQLRLGDEARGRALLARAEALEQGAAPRARP